MRSLGSLGPCTEGACGTQTVWGAGIWAAAYRQGLLPIDLPVTTMRLVGGEQHS